MKNGGGIVKIAMKNDLFVNNSLQYAGHPGACRTSSSFYLHPLAFPLKKSLVFGLCTCAKC